MEPRCLAPACRASNTCAVAATDGLWKLRGITGDSALRITCHTMSSADICKTSTLSPQRRDGTLPTYWPSSIEKKWILLGPERFSPLLVGCCEFLLIASGSSRHLGVFLRPLYWCSSNALTNVRLGLPVTMIMMHVVKEHDRAPCPG